MRARKARPGNPAALIIVSFLVIVIIGALLLTLPIASRDRTWTDPVTTLFTATSATCVTGLIMVDTFLHWSAFGQAVIITMIQVGGLGFMTVLAMVLMLLRRRITYSQRLLMMNTLNLSNMDEVLRLVRLALIGTFSAEGVGAVLLMFRFVPQYGAAGIWRSVFTAISCFCNAGFDLNGSIEAFSSMNHYVNDPWVCGILMVLIVISGLGFFVWSDLLSLRKGGKLSLYSRLVLSASAVLVIGGFVFFLLAEWNNPDTIGNMTVPQKILAALFQSITLRTAGFNTVDQSCLTEASRAFSCLLMVIGGCSGSTAGGVKVVTAVVLLRSLWAGLTGKTELVIGGRTIPHQKVVDAINLVLIALILIFFGSVFITAADGVPFLDALYEACSAMGTVGLTVGITPTLCTASHLILICIMFLGRVGILSVSVAFLARSSAANRLSYPEGWVMIG